jgi:hypothetical protein
LGQRDRAVMNVPPGTGLKTSTMAVTEAARF